MGPLKNCLFTSRLIYSCFLLFIFIARMGFISAAMFLILQQLPSGMKRASECSKLELSFKRGARLWVHRSRMLSLVFSFLSLCRVFPISSAGLLVQPGWPQPRRCGVEARREPGHQERFDPGEGLSGLFLGVKMVVPTLRNTFGAWLDRWRFVSTSWPTRGLSDMNLTVMMIDVEAGGRRGVKMQFKNRLVVHAVHSRPLSNEVFRWSSHRNKCQRVLHVWSVLSRGGGSAL